jgi:hypothetical protein
MSAPRHQTPGPLALPLRSTYRDCVQSHPHLTLVMLDRPIHPHPSHSVPSSEPFKRLPQGRQRPYHPRHTSSPARRIGAATEQNPLSVPQVHRAV